MLNNLPLHALIVHMPIALTVLVPLFMVVAFALGRKQLTPLLAWAVPVGLLALQLATGVMADKTGEQQEDRVENVVPPNALEEHEEAAELFLVVTAANVGHSGGSLVYRYNAGAVYSRAPQGGGATSTRPHPAPSDDH